MGNYRLIRDLDKLRYFVDILPELDGKGEVYLIRLIVRSKCVSRIDQDRDIKREVVYKKSDIISVIEQMECREGLYMGLSSDELGVYITLNPRDLGLCVRNNFLATGNLIGRVDINPIDILYNNLRFSGIRSRMEYFDCDFDRVSDKREQIIEMGRGLINFDCVKVLYTMNGLHFLIRVLDIDLGRYPEWRRDISLLPGYDGSGISGDNMIPVVGCTQFGYIPHFE